MPDRNLDSREPTEPEPDDAGNAESGAADGSSTAGRPFWSGMLTFGLVSIPVDLLPATRNVSVGLRVLGAAGKRLQRHYYCPAHDEDVPNEHIVRGYETRDGQYIPVSDEELEALDPKKSREIDLRLFVPKASIAPAYFERAYLLVPSAESGKAYALLSMALEAREHAGIATFVMRDREYWVAIFATNGLLRAETLRFAEYVRDARDVGLGTPEKPGAQRIDAYARVVEALRTDALPTSELQDEYASALAALAQRKAHAGKDVVQPSEAPATTSQGNVIDLIEVLKQRLAESGFDVNPSSPANDTAEHESTAAAAPRRSRRSNDSKPGLRKAALRDTEPTRSAAPRKAAAASSKARTPAAAPRRSAKKATRVKRAAH